ncbi:MAG: PSD1 and planctomycete cytochrome C domain-containing protein [Planctomycetota bacterium]
MNRQRVSILWFGLAWALSHCQAEEVSFTRDIRPILSDRCFKCHGPDANAREADLRLDESRGALDSGAIIPGAPDESSLIERTTTDDPDLRMPPDGEPLTAEQIGVLRDWISAGAKYERHWAYEKPNPGTPPRIEQADWQRINAIDQFVQARLVENGMQPAQSAEPAVLLRRLSLDLIGLPPSVDEVTAFEQNPSLENYEAAIDRLLDSEHFGEKWALPWLDLARYADSNGYQHDDLRTMWPYRDWVINALNQDMPFDQFTIEQLAGDLLPQPNRNQLIATGFHRNVPTNFSGGSKVNELRADVLHDRVSTTGQVWLGMTMECCQCHDHKYDPISQKDYYKLYAYFNQSVTEFALEGPGMFRKKFIGAELPVVASREDAARVKAISEQIRLEAAALQEAKPHALAEQAAWEEEFKASGRAADIPWERFRSHLRRGDRFLGTPPERRTGDEQAKVEALLYYDHRFTGPYEKAIDRLLAAREKIVARTMVMKDADRNVPTHIFLRGDYRSRGEQVNASVPEVLHPIDPSLPPNRLGLAKWLVHPDNPLTARVTANRIWAEIFGQGIVTTLEDFGMQSDSPSHPELLDWLAIELVRDGWSTKQFIKTIVMSSTYRQSSAAASEQLENDPSNRWLARGPRFRLSGELIRDNALFISGLLTEKIGGPSVYPPQPDGLWREISGADVTTYRVSQGADRYRRGLYTFLRRGNPNPMVLNFDGSNRSSCVIKRGRSNTPVQALNLLNAPTFVEATHAFADWMESIEGKDEDKIVRAFRRAVARHPSDAEIEALCSLYRKHNDWFSVAQVLLNLDETITKS